MTDEIENYIPAKAIIHPEAIASLLSVTPDKLAEIRKEQEHLAQLKNSRARLNPEEMMRARGAELERHHLKTGDMDNLAEALAMQGRYAEAAIVANRQDLKDHFTEMSEAVECSDEMCDCDPFRREGNLNIPNHSDEHRGWSEKHGKTVHFIRCFQCKRLNARAPLRRLEELRQIRHQAIKTKKEKTSIEIFGSRT